jgi:hypothetical protein
MARVLGCLQSTGYGNLFMVFGEPDVAIQPQLDGTITVTIKVWTFRT